MKQKEFLKIEGALVATPLTMETGEMSGWKISRNGISLHSNRGGVRPFRALCSVAVFCKNNDIKSFSVKGI